MEWIYPLIPSVLRKTKNETISSRYTKSLIFILTDGFIVRTRSVSLISEEDRNKKIEIPFNSINELSVIREDKKLNFNKKEYNITTDRLLIRYGNGYKLLLPMHVDIKSKELEARLKKFINEYKEKNSTESK